MDIVDNLSNQFNMQELIKIAECVDISPISTWGSRKLIDVINSKLDKGIPNVSKIRDDIRPLFMDFLYVANYLDEQGQIVEKLKEDLNVTILDTLEDLGISEPPDCFSYADDQDVACKRCPVFRHCAEYRLSNLPPCYGHLYDKSSSKCQQCMEAALCKLSNKSSEVRHAEITMNFG